MPSKETQTKKEKVIFHSADGERLHFARRTVKFTAAQLAQRCRDAEREQELMFRRWSKAKGYRLIGAEGIECKDEGSQTD